MINNIKSLRNIFLFLKNVNLILLSTDSKIIVLE